MTLWGGGILESAVALLVQSSTLSLSSLVQELKLGPIPFINVQYFNSFYYIFVKDVYGLILCCLPHTLLQVFIFI